MKHIKAYIIGAALVSAAFAAAAQQASRTAYFLDGYTYRHELNPALGGERGYVSIPVLANIGIGLRSNIGVNTFLYDHGAKPGYDLTTFMSPSISADEFLGKLHKYNHVNANLDLTLLSFGFKAFGGFNTFSAGVRAEVGAVIPKDLFAFIKQGQTSTDTRYSFSNFQFNLSAMAEVELGHSRAITDKLDAGAKLKFLIGLGNASAKINRMDIRLSDQEWSVDAEGELNIAAGPGIYLPTREEVGGEYTPEEADLIEWDEFDFDSYGLSGFGMALDLGATYKLLPDLTLSAAVLDFGFMGWSNNIQGRTSAKPWTFAGFKDVAIMSDQDNYEEKKLSQQVDDMLDGLEDMVNFHRTSNGGTRTQMLHATINLGAEYNMPFYRNLTAGFLFSQYIAGCSSWTEGRFSANVKPVKWFDATISYGASTYGSSFGWMLNFHPKGFNFFIGSDHQFFKVTPQFVPVGHATAALNLGFNVTFGS